MMAHDLRFVRMNLDDDTLHCERHGLLTAEEAENVYQRLPITEEQVRQAPKLDWIWRIRERLSQRHGPRCVELVTIIDVSKQYIR